MYDVQLTSKETARNVASRRSTASYFLKEGDNPATNSDLRPDIYKTPGCEKEDGLLLQNFLVFIGLNERC